jgi:hypothetical protein
MKRTRREARMVRLLPRLACALGVILAAGCSRSPKPRAEVPAPVPRPGAAVASDTTRATAGRNGAPRRGSTAPNPTRAGAGATTAGARNAPSVSGARAGSSTSSPPVVPQLTAAEQERLENETRDALEQATRKLDAVEVAKLDADQNRKYLIARDFLTQAGEARTRKEFERAQGLALKARLLAEEIAAH